MTKTNTESCSALPKIVAVDFDGTLVEDKFPDIGKPYYTVIEILCYLQQRDGLKLILWTCRTDNNENEKYLTEAIEFCSERGLEFDAINDNIQEVKDYFGNNPRKIFANYYLDDRNISSVHKLERELWQEKIQL